MPTGLAPTEQDKVRPPLEVRTTSDSHFAWLRTRLSAERTLMSWMRTAVSMIGFGFTIVQFFERLQGVEGLKAPRSPEAPRYVGLALIAAGTLALLISAWQYHTLLNYLWSDTYRAIAPPRHGLTPTYAISIIIVCIGIVTFVSVIARLG